MSPISRGFRHLQRVPASQESRLPPGRYVTKGCPLEAEQSRLARLLVPHLYFWKNAKWCAA